MTVKLPPHRPTPGELDAAKAMELPHSEGYVDAMLDLAHRAALKHQPAEAVSVLRAVALVRPDEPRIYEAFAQLYRDQGRQKDATLCLEEARRLKGK